MKARRRVVVTLTDAEARELWFAAHSDVTDAEDSKLRMGLRSYNTLWRALDKLRIARLGLVPPGAERAEGSR